MESNRTDWLTRGLAPAGAGRCWRCVTTCVAVQAALPWCVNQLAAELAALDLGVQFELGVLHFVMKNMLCL